ncbi:MAG: rRNA maturation RNase YbeY [Planctomycetota bacterium]|jgi:probable rRNA maturation factor
MNASASTIRRSQTSADEADDPGSSSTSDADNPPERTPEPASGPNTAPADVEVAWCAQIDETARNVDVRWLRDRLLAALAEIPRPARHISVTLAGDERMRALSRRHLGVDDSTDVLTFELSSADEPLEADIVVSVDEAARRTAQLKHTIERELLLYALHGVLHCAGFDDATTAGFRAMHAEEDRILTVIDVGLTFARDQSGHDDDRRKRLVTEGHSID